jgi:hypothetical protein
MAYENWVFNDRSKFRHSNSVEQFYNDMVKEQVKFYHGNYLKYLDLFKHIPYNYMKTYDKLVELEHQEKTFMTEFNNAKDVLESGNVWKLSKIFGTSTTTDMLNKKIASINDGLEYLERILNTYYTSIIKTLMEDVASLELKHSIDIDALISEEKLIRYQTLRREEEKKISPLDW